MKIPENIKFEYLLSLDNHIETVGIERKKETLKKIFDITKKIADLGFSEDDIRSIAEDEKLYTKYEKWRMSKK